jgi:2-alkenal reductase
MQPPTPTTQQTSKPEYRLRAVLIAALVSGILGGVIGATAIYLAFRNPTPDTMDTTPTPPLLPTPASLSRLIETAVTDVVENVGPAVVTVINNLPPRRTIFGGLIENAASGSGVIISQSGHIVTNNHVISGAQSLEVILADGTTLPAELIGVDEYSDLAILKVHGEIPIPASWGNSDMLKAGEPVVAIGSPLGDFTNTVTQGVVSAVERTIEIEQNYFLEGLIQTDAAINQGNSGGPLLNTAGKVIGINTLIVRGSGSGAIAEGLGFAIPSNTAQAIADQLIKNGYFARPYSGIRWVNVTPSLASRYRLPSEWGIYITEIDPDGPAENAGLHRGDIITALNGEPIDEDHPFRNILFQYQPEETVAFTFIRENTVITTELTLGAMH